MTNPNEDRSELFVRFHRKSLFALMMIILVMGGTGLSLALWPALTVGKYANTQWWMLPVGIVIFISLFTFAGGRRFSPEAPEVLVATHDEGRRTNMLRAARAALIVVLVGQWPLGLALGFLTQPHLAAPRIAIAMAAATNMLGIVTTISFFLYFDRE